jgi:hypothetical protein
MQRMRGPERERRIDRVAAIIGGSTALAAIVVIAVWAATQGGAIAS